MVEYIQVGISVIVALAGIIISIVTLKKKGETTKLSGVYSKLPQFICEAEEIVGKGNGLLKLQYVLNKVQLECYRLNVKYDEIEVQQKIQEIGSTPEFKDTIRSDIIE